MTKTTINKEVSVTRVGFKKNLAAYPRQVEYDGAVYTFINAGLSCTVRTGERIRHILTLADGHAQFRLCSDNMGGAWTLLSISA